MKVSEVRVKDESVICEPSVTQNIEEKTVNTFSDDQNEMSRSKAVPNNPFIQINTKASYKEITYVSRRGRTNVPEPAHAARGR